MITHQEATIIISKCLVDYGTEDINISLAEGRILKEDWYSDRDMPPYNRITMDGIAINYDAAKLVKELKIEGIAAAGNEQLELVDITQCIEVMTGAVLPNNCDTVIRYEDLNIENKAVIIRANFSKGQNIHLKGEDHKKGSRILSSGVLLSCAEIGVGATIGKHTVRVAKFPKTIVVSTGDELVDVVDTPKDHQIRKSNVYRLRSLLISRGLSCDMAHLPDDKEIISNQLSDILKNFQVVILSGGVSKGKFDYLPDMLSELGVKKHFHGIAQRPGKPMWFGKNDMGVTVFALPGNPVSSFMCANVYLLPWLKKSMGLLSRPLPHAILQTNVTFNPQLTYFVIVKIDIDKMGHLLAWPQKSSGSGDLTVLTKGDGFMKLPIGKNQFNSGDAYPVYIYRNIYAD